MSENVGIGRFSYCPGMGGGFEINKRGIAQMNRPDPGSVVLGQPRSVTVVLGCRVAVAVVTYRPVMAGRLCTPLPRLPPRAGPG